MGKRFFRWVPLGIVVPLGSVGPVTPLAPLAPLGFIDVRCSVGSVVPMVSDVTLGSVVPSVWIVSVVLLGSLDPMGSFVFVGSVVPLGCVVVLIQIDPNPSRRQHSTTQYNKTTKNEGVGGRGGSL